MRRILIFCVLTAGMTIGASFWQTVRVVFGQGKGNSPPLSITTTALPIGKTNTPYGATLSATGGKAPYSWDATSGLPNGIRVSGSSLAGSVTATVNANPTLVVKDKTGALATKTLPLAICAPLTVTPQTFPAMKVGTPVNIQLQSSGGVASTTPPLCIL